jgi:cytochrome c-type biogenesis protein
MPSAIWTRLFVSVLLSSFAEQSLGLIPSSHRYGGLSSLNRISPLKFSGDIGVDIYDAQLAVSSFVESQLSTASPTSIAFLYGAGLLTAFSPCSISLLPLTLTYLGGSEVSKSTSTTAFSGSEIAVAKSENKVLSRSLLYATGLATTLTLFGLSAAMLGNVFGSSGAVGDVASLLSSTLFFTMGLYLLGIVNIDFPSFEIKNDKKGILSSGNAQAFVLGGTSALVASPCSSPVLTSLLAFVAASGDATIGTMKNRNKYFYMT